MSLAFDISSTYCIEKVNRIKAGKLADSVGGRMHMLGYLEPETRSNKADRVPILFPFEVIILVVFNWDIVILNAFV